jgi:putative endopeptidase
MLARVGQPLDRDDHAFTPYAIAPSYDRVRNALVIPTGALQLPLYLNERSVAANLGGLGASIGRELAKGFALDKILENEPRAMCHVSQYAEYEVAPRVFIDGKRTLYGNLVEQAGAAFAFAAYRELRRMSDKRYLADGYDDDQQFFIALAQASCEHVPRDQLLSAATNGPHAPTKFRVYGALRNLPEFAAAFRCAAGTPMKPAKPCPTW